MADYTQTITNSINFFGASRTNNWGVMLWGDKWGIGNYSVITDVDKTIVEAPNISDSYYVAFDKTIYNTINTDTDIVNIYLTDDNGYNYIFKKPTIDSNQRVDTDYDLVSSTSSIYLSITASSSTWSTI